MENKNKSRTKRNLVVAASIVGILSVGAGVAGYFGLHTQIKNNVSNELTSENKPSIQSVDTGISTSKTWYLGLSAGQTAPKFSAVFSVNNLPADDVSYQWYATNSTGSVKTLIYGATGLTFSPSFNHSELATYYYLCVAAATYNNKTYTATSQVYTLSVSQAPTISVSVDTNTIYANQNETTYQTISASASVSSGVDLSYQWYTTNTAYKTETAVTVDGATLYEIPGADKSTYTLTKTDLTTAGTYNYYLQVTGTINGATYTTNSASYGTVVVSNAASITIKTNNNNQINVLENESTNLPAFNPTVTLNNANGQSISYQWYTTNSAYSSGTAKIFNGVTYYAIAGADNAYYDLTATDTSVLGDFNYIVVATAIVNGVTVSANNAADPYSVAILKSGAISIGTITNTNVFQDQKASVSVNANVNIPAPYNTNVTYNWYEVVDGKATLLSGQNSNVLLLDSADFSTVGTLSFYLSVSASYNGQTITATSNTFNVYVNAINAVTFSGNTETNAYKGQTATTDFVYTLNNLNNNAVNTYQWYTTNSAYSGEDSLVFNGVTYYEISGATNASYVTNNTDYSVDGTFDYILVVNSNYNGTNKTYSSASVPFVLNVSTLSAMAVTFGSTNYNLSVTAGSTNLPSLIVNATAAGSVANLTYQWYENGTVLDGATSSTLALNGLISDESATFYVVVTYKINGVSVEATSPTYTVDVTDAPTVNFQTNTLSVNATVGETSYQTLTATATASDSALTVYYQWYLADSSFVTNGQAFSTNSSYTLTAADVKTAGTLYYLVKAYVVVGGTKYYSQSNLEITVNVTAANNGLITLTNPSVLTFNTYAESTKAVTLNVVASADSQVTNLTYTWYAGASLTDFSGTEVATGQTYTYTPGQTVGANYFYCVVSGLENGVKISQTSKMFTVYVNTAPTIDFNSDLQYTYRATNGTTPITLSTGALLTGFTNLTETDSALNSVVLSYTWYNGTGTEIGSGNTYTLSKTEMNSSTALTFYVVASVEFNGLTISQKSSTYTVSFTALPTLQSATITGNYATAFAGQKAAITLDSTVSASQNSGITYTYQWYVGDNEITATNAQLASDPNQYGTVINGANNSSYTFVAPGQTSYYFLIVTATYDDVSLNTVASNVYTLTINSAPTITFNSGLTYTVKTTNNATNLPTLMTGAAVNNDANANLTYTWYGVKGATQTAVGTGTALALTWQEINAYTSFIVIASTVINGTTIEATSNAYTVDVTDPTTITFAKNLTYTKTAYVGQTDDVVFTTAATASNGGVVTYTWYLASSNTALDTGSSLTWKTFTTAGTQDLYVIASTVENGTTITAKSQIYTLNVLAAPTININSVLGATKNKSGVYEINATLNETVFQTAQVNAAISTGNFALTYAWSQDTSNNTNSYTLTAADVASLSGPSFSLTISADVNGETISQTLNFQVVVTNAAQVVWTNLANYAYTTIVGATTPINLSVSASPSQGNYGVTYSWYESTAENTTNLTALNNNTSSYAYTAQNVKTASTVYIYVKASFVENGVTVSAYSQPFVITINADPTITWTGNTTYSAYQKQSAGLTLTAQAVVSDSTNDLLNVPITYTWADGSTGANYTLTAADLNTLKTVLTETVTATATYLGVTITKTATITINLKTLPTITLSSSNNATINVTKGETQYQTIYTSAAISDTSYGVNYVWVDGALNSTSALSTSTVIANTSVFTLNSNYVQTSTTISVVAYTMINGTAVYSNILTFNLDVQSAPTLAFNKTTTNYTLLQKQTAIPALSATATANSSNTNISYAWFTYDSANLPSDLTTYLTTNLNQAVSHGNNYSPSFSTSNLGTKYYLCLAYLDANGVYTVSGIIFTYNIVDGVSLVQNDANTNFTTTIGASNPVTLTANISVSGVPSNTTWNVGPISYQWYETTAAGTAGTAISGANSQSYQFSAAKLTKTGTYYFYCVGTVIINGVTIQTTTMKTFTVNVTNTPTVNWNQMSTTIDVLTGTDTILSASATSSDPSYQVYYSWSNGTTTANLTLDDVKADATYTVQAYILVNGTKVSAGQAQTFTVNVYQEPDAYFDYTATTLNYTVNQNSTGQTVLSAPAVDVNQNNANYDVSGLALNYVWYTSGGKQVATGANYTLNNAAITASGQYYVKAYYLIDGVKCYVKTNNGATTSASETYSINYLAFKQLTLTSQNYAWYQANTNKTISIDVANPNSYSVYYVWTVTFGNVTETLTNNAATLSGSVLKSLLAKNGVGTYTFDVQVGAIINNVKQSPAKTEFTLDYLADPTLKFTNAALSQGFTVKTTLGSLIKLNFDGSAYAGATNYPVTLNYQWSLNGQVLSGETGSSLSVGANSKVGRQDYSVVVTAVYDGEVVATLTSGNIVLVTQTQPTITITTSDSQTLTYLPGYNINQTISVGSNGTNPTYTWALNGKTLSTSGDSINLNNLALSGDSTLTVYATSVIDGVNISSSTLTFTINLTTVPTLTWNQTTTNYQLTNSGSPTLTGTAAISANSYLAANTTQSIVYRWLSSGETVGGDSSYTPDVKLNAGDTVEYTESATLYINGVKTNETISQTFTLTQTATPTLTFATQPSASTIYADSTQTATLSASAVLADANNYSGAVNLTYTWYTADGAEVGTGSAISVQPTKTTSYYCVVSGTIGTTSLTAITSNTVTVTVLPEPTLSLTSSNTAFTYYRGQTSNIILSTKLTSNDTYSNVTYVWAQNGNALNDDESFLNLTSFAFSGTQTFTVYAELTLNGYSTPIKSQTVTFTLTQNTLPSVTLSPSQSTVTTVANESSAYLPTLSVYAENNSENLPITYAWYESSVQPTNLETAGGTILNSTSNSYTLTASDVNVSANTVKYYWAIGTITVNGVSEHIYLSHYITLNINVPTLTLSGTSSYSVYAGQTTIPTFSVTTQNKDNIQNLTYTWTSGDKTVATTNAGSYQLTALPSQTTTYTVTVSGTINGVSVTSVDFNITLTVNQLSVHSLNLQVGLAGTQNYTVYQGVTKNNPKLVATATSTSNAVLTYTWYTGTGTKIASGNILQYAQYSPYLTLGSTTTIYVVVTATIDGATVTLSSQTSSETFGAYQITEVAQPTINGGYNVITSANTTNVYQYSTGLNLTPSVSSQATLSYQWYSTNKNSNANIDNKYYLISGATNLTYTPSTDTVGTITYLLVVTEWVNGVDVGQAYAKPETVNVTANTLSVVLTYNGQTINDGGTLYLVSGANYQNIAYAVSLNGNLVTSNLSYLYNGTAITSSDLTVNAGSNTFQATYTFGANETATTTIQFNVVESDITDYIKNTGGTVPAITAAASNTNVYIGQTTALPQFNLNVNNPSNYTLTYKWNNGTTGNKTSYTVSGPISLATSPQQTCTVYITIDGVTAVLTTETFTLTINKAPSNTAITFSGNTAVTTYAGITTNLPVLSANATLNGYNVALSYTWNNVSLVDFTANNTSAYSLTAKDLATAGTYQVSVTASAVINGLTIEKSEKFTITVLSVPTFTWTQTNPTLYFENGQTSLSEAFGLTYTSNSALNNALSITYAWTANGKTVGSSNTYTPTDVTAGTYDLLVTVTYDGNTLLTKTFTYNLVQATNPTVTLNNSTALTTLEENSTGQLSVSVSYSTTPEINPTLTYQWESGVNNNGTYTWTAINNANSATYSPQTSTTGVTYYRVLVTVTYHGLNSQTYTSDIYTVQVITPVNASDYSLQFSQSQYNYVYKSEESPVYAYVVNIKKTDAPIISYSYSWQFGNTTLASYASTSNNFVMPDTLLDKWGVGYYTLKLNMTITLSTGQQITLDQAYCPLYVLSPSISVEPTTTAQNVTGYVGQTSGISLNPSVTTVGTNTNKAYSQQYATTINNVGAVAYQWASGTSADNLTNISGATNATYNLTSDNLATSGTTYYALTVTWTASNGTVLATTTYTYTVTLNTMPDVTVKPAGTTTYSIYTTQSTSSLPILNSVVAGLPNYTNGVNLSVSYQWYRNGTAISGATNSYYALNANDLALSVGTYDYLLKVTVTLNGVSATYTMNTPYVITLNSKLTITSQPATLSGKTTFSVGTNYVLTASAEFATSDDQSVSYYWQELTVDPNATLASGVTDYNTWTTIVGQSGSGLNSVTATLSLGSTVASTPTQKFRCVFYDTNNPSNQVVSNTITITTTYNTNSEQTQNLEALLANPYWDMGLIYSYGGTALLNLLYGQSNHWNIFGLQVNDSSGNSFSTNSWTGTLTSVRYVTAGTEEFGSSKYLLPWNSFLVTITTTSPAYVCTYGNGWNTDKQSEVPAGSTISMYLPIYFFGTTSYSQPDTNNVITTTRTINVASDGASSVAFAGQASDTSEDFSAFTLMIEATTQISVYGYTANNGSDILNGSILEFQVPGNYGNGSGPVTFDTANTDGYMPNYSLYQG